MLNRALASAETAFRKSAMWAYAFNQSPAKIVMWKKVTAGKHASDAISVDEWTKQLFGAHG